MNEEVLNQLLEEIKKLRLDVYHLKEAIDSRDKIIENLSDFLSKNGFDTSKEEIENVVSEEVDKINPNEPKDIMVVNPNEFKVDDSLIYGTDYDNYGNKIKKDFVDNFISEQNEKVEEKESEEDTAEKQPEEKLDDDQYITGTNIPKPRNRGIFETDEEYENFLKEYYSKYFPESKELAVINSNEPKELAAIEDVAKNDAIKKVEDALDKINSRDIYSNSDGTSSSIAKEIEEEKKKREKKKTEKIKFSSDEEKKKFERDVTTDYKKDKNKKSTKIKKIRKCIKKFKEVLKKHGKKIIAGILVATAAIGAAMSLKACSYEDDASKNFVDDTKSNSDYFGSTVPSEKRADEISNGQIDKDDIVDKFFDDDKENDKTATDGKTENQKPANSNDKNDKNDFNIGEPAQFTGDSLYYTADDAAKDNNALTPDLPKESERTISLINFVSPDGLNTATAHTPEEADKLRASGWIEKAYNFTNDTYNVDYEGWTTKDDLKKVK